MSTINPFTVPLTGNWVGTGEGCGVVIVKGEVTPCYGGFHVSFNEKDIVIPFQGETLSGSVMLSLVGGTTISKAGNELIGFDTKLQLLSGISMMELNGTLSVYGPGNGKATLSVLVNVVPR